MMKIFTRLSSKVPLFQVFLLISLVLLGGAGCQALASEATPTEQHSPAETAPPTAASPEPTLEPDLAAAEPDPGEENQCLLCHTDQQALMDTADPVVQIEAESSGEG